MKRFLTILLTTILIASSTVIPLPAKAEGTLGISGSFIQPWLYCNFSENRMDKEFAEMKKTGIDTLIMGDIAVKHYNDDGWDLAYPSSLPEFDNCSKPDYVTILFKYCKKYGIKLYLGLGLDSSWWNRNLANPSDAQWLSDMCDLHAKIAKDLYAKYDSYGDTFGGYYWVYEVWNHNCWDYAATRELYARALANGFNKVIDAINSVDSKRPLIFSPFATRKGFSSSENLTKFYTRFFELTNFRKQDAMAPMDNIGGGGQILETLDEWTKAYYDAFQNTGNKLQFWSNCEDFVQEPVITTGLVDRFAQQLAITSRYCTKIITFAWNHYYSPYNTDPGFNKSYLHYIETGALETTPPTAPKTVTVTGRSVANIDSSGFTDDYGIARYRLYRIDNGAATLIDQHYITRYDNGMSSGKTLISPRFSSVSITKGKTNYFVLEAVDCTGNSSRIYIPVNGDNPSDRSMFTTGSKGYYTYEEYRKGGGSDIVFPDVDDDVVNNTGTQDDIPQTTSGIPTASTSASGAVSSASEDTLSSEPADSSDSISISSKGSVSSKSAASKQPSSKKAVIIIVSVAGVLIAAGGVCLFIFRDKVFPKKRKADVSDFISEDSVNSDDGDKPQGKE